MSDELARLKADLERMAAMIDALAAAADGETGPIAPVLRGTAADLRRMLRPRGEVVADVDPRTRWPGSEIRSEGR